MWHRLALLELCISGSAPAQLTTASGASLKEALGKSVPIEAFFREFPTVDADADMKERVCII